MIVDYIENWETYARSDSVLRKGFSFLQEILNKPAGRYEKDCMFAMVQEGRTMPSEKALLETHEKYIDIQYMISGGEVMEWKNRKETFCEVPYDADRDIAFHHGNGVGITIHPGMFYIVYPQDAHKPCIQIKEPAGYKKVVLKIPAGACPGPENGKENI